MRKSTVTAYFRVDLDFYKEVEEARMKLGQTRTQFIIDAINKHLEDLKNNGVIDKVYKIRGDK